MFSRQKPIVQHNTSRSMGALAAAISFRISLPVTKITVRTRGDCYPVCPRCKCSLDREYMNFCDRCGQKLDWSLFSFGEILSRLK